MFNFMLGKTHIPHRKNTAGAPAVRMPAPDTVRIIASQHIGAPAIPTVKVGDAVYVGTKIGEADGAVSAPIHSSVSGKVKKLEPHLCSSGKSCMSIVIESDGEMTPDPSIAPPKVESIDDLINAVRESGLVGLGGAGFPTAVKLEAAKKGIIKHIVLNGAECEPYITSDTYTMLEKSDKIKAGVEILEKFTGAKKVTIGIESNKPECIAKLGEVFASKENVSIVALPSTYPQGAEKILVFNSTGKVIPEGKLPSDVGCLVMNITSVAFLAEYLETGMPLVEKCVTVDGSAIKNPMKVICPIGTSIEKLIEFTGGYKCEAGKILYGGPMMGVSVYTPEDPIVKNNNAIIAFNKKDAKLPPTRNCIHCGRCVSNCPMGLNPALFAKAMKVEDKAERIERLKEAKLMLCMECGCCSFVCPSVRPLVENNRLGKAELRSSQAKK